MAKKTEYIHIRADQELKDALSKAAARHVRGEADEARYILMKGLGLLIEEDAAPYARGEPRHKDKGRGHAG